MPSSLDDLGTVKDGDFGEETDDDFIFIGQRVLRGIQDTVGLLSPVDEEAGGPVS